MNHPTYTRPMPPESMRQQGLGFARAEELEDFVRQEFLSREGIFFDPEHGHLTSAIIGVLWASSVHIDKGSEKAGTAQLLKGGEPTKWGQAMNRAYLHQMFGLNLPAFLITLSAPVWQTYNDKEAFALVDHELSHCAVAKDVFGVPRFNRDTGLPVWSMRPHESEQFSGTVERWGAAATGTSGIVLAGLKTPRFNWVPGKELDVRKACGTP